MCSKMNAIFVLSARIYFLGFIISQNYRLGSSNLIEFVEEWGCYDSEIRLTCGHLDSKIAILEATFSPNCTQEECIKGDLKRLMQGHSRAKFIDYRTAETEAGRKFLQTLRQSDESQSAELVGPNTAAANNGVAAVVNEPLAQSIDDAGEPVPQANRFIGFKEKRATLRASLERLIVKYLRQIAPDENFDEINKRRRREAALESDKSESIALSSVPVKSTSERIMIGTRNVSVDDFEARNRPVVDGDEKFRKIYESRPFCPEQKRQIGTLRRLEIDKTLQKVNDTRQNIRKVLNKRCSGKNHCSFLFAADDPLAILWDSGLVHIKYACMDEYHTNHYCNEHLTIGYDNSPKRREIVERRGEPHAEARIQPQSQIFHSLKILKSDDEAEEMLESNADLPPAAAAAAKVQEVAPEKLPKAKKKEKEIYSQDFKVLKILPSNLDDFNDIEQIGDEIYFRTDDISANTDIKSEIFPSVLVPTSLTLGTDSSKSSGPILSAFSTNAYPANSLEIDEIEMFSSPGNNGSKKNKDTANGGLSKFENVTIIIREGEQYFETFSEPRLLDNLAVVVNESKPMTNSATANNSTVTASYYTSSSSTASITTSTTSEPLQLYLPTLPSPPPLLPTPQPSILPTGPTMESAVDATSSSKTTTVENRLIYGDRRLPEQDDIEFIENEQDIRVVPTVGELSMVKGGGDEGAARRQHATVSREFDDSDSRGYAESGIVRSYDDNVDDDLFEEQEYDNVRLQYTSIQRTFYGRPKSQGFTMTPGYPKFYIGECECKWKILAPIRQKIRLTILDISLRHERNCRDYLEIIDVESSRRLYKSCEEPNWPIEIVSESNEVEIVVKAQTKFAYPKRGILIHYAALGCLTPPPPMHGRFVERTESAAIFECDETYIFPDTATNRRELLCGEQHIWDRSLPDCIEENATSDSGIVSGLSFDTSKNTEIVNRAKMGHTETDTVFDIVLPSVVIVGLFAINAVVFIIIMRLRKRSHNRLDAEAKELAEL